MLLLAVVYGLLAVAHAVLPSVPIGGDPGHQSMPHLLDVKLLDDLALTWKTAGTIHLDTGRLVVDAGSGSAWSIQTLANTKNEWTIEYTFRYGKKVEDNYNYNPANGLSFWLVDPGVSSDTLNYGGPAKYDGFQIAVNIDTHPGLKIFANDGSKSGNSLEHAVGYCDFNYLELDVPLTVRVSYSKTSGVFKVQVDNNLCFRTEAIVIPDVVDYKFGVSASIGAGSTDFFEVFGVNVWGHLTEDAIDDHGLMASGGVKVEQAPAHAPAKGRKSLMEKQREIRLQFNTPPPSIPSADLSAVVERLQAIEQTIAQMPSAFQDIHSYIVDIQLVESKQAIVLHDLQRDYTDLKSTLTQQYGQMLEAVAKLNEKLIGEVREHQYAVDELGKKVDLLMAGHKEIAHKYDSSKVEIPVEPPKSLVVEWVLVPLFIVMIVLAVFVYRLRHDIKHAKYL